MMGNVQICGSDIKYVRTETFAFFVLTDSVGTKRELPAL
jgi:hypothetical protein